MNKERNKAQSAKIMHDKILKSIPMTIYSIYVVHAQKSGRVAKNSNLARDHQLTTTVSDCSFHNLFWNNAWANKCWCNDEAS